MSDWITFLNEAGSLGLLGFLIWLVGRNAAERDRSHADLIAKLLDKVPDAERREE